MRLKIKRVRILYRWTSQVSTEPYAPGSSCATDYVDVVVHIFQTELRSFYKLEELWADAPMTKYEYEE